MNKPINILIAALAIALIGAIIYIVIREGRISELELQSEAYNLRIEQEEKSRLLLTEEKQMFENRADYWKSVAEQLEKELENIPSDDNIKNNSNIKLLTPNANWAAIKGAIDEAIQDSSIVQ